MNAQTPCQLRLLAGWSTAGLSHQPTPRGRSATQLQQAVVPLWLKRMAMDNRFSRIDEVTSRGGFDGADQIPHGRCRWFQGFLSRGETSRCAEAAAPARFPERGPYVP